MSNRLPYEDYLKQQWHDLPLPAEDPAWLDMKRRLDEDEDDGVIVWWRRGCLGWGIALLVLIALGWWIFGNSGIFKSSKSGVPTESSTPAKSSSTGNSDSLKMDSFAVDQRLRTKNDMDSAKSIEDLKKVSDTSVSLSDIDGSMKRLDEEEEKKSDTKPKNDAELGKNSRQHSEKSLTPADISRLNKKTRNEEKEKTQVSNEQRNSERKHVEKRKAGSDPSNKQPPMDVDLAKNKPANNDNGNQGIPAPDKSRTKADSTAGISKPDLVKKQTGAGDTATLGRKPAPVVKKPGTEDSTINNKKPKAKEKFVYFSAGAALNQQLPLFGQKFTPYNAQGRNGSLSDYIPSVYARYNKSEKWFVQAEFRYGAPQYTKEILYDKKIDLDPLGRPLSTLHTVKKTYYHQLPVSFNYYLFKNFSIGAGVIANKFSSAVFDEQVIITDNLTQTDTLVSSGVFRSKNEKAFSKFYMQALFETQFKWKRFSLGGRYSFGLQPYLKFTLPGAPPQTERNQAAQVFLRYEFFRSKKKYK